MTGAGSGIGKASAVAFAKVGVLSQTRAEIDDTAAEIKKNGGDAPAVTGDVADAVQVEAVVQQLVGHDGRLDAVYANGGATAYAVSKAGQLAMAKMLAVELGAFDIRINAICPGRSRPGSATTRTSGTWTR